MSTERSKSEAGQHPRNDYIFFSRLLHLVVSRLCADIVFECFLLIGQTEMPTGPGRIIPAAHVAFIVLPYIAGGIDWSSLHASNLPG